MNKDITPYNEQGQPHGYCEVYFPNGRLSFKGEYIHGKEQGYFIEYCNKSYYKLFYKNGEAYYKNRCVQYCYFKPF